MILSPGTRLGQYDIIAPLGSGGMGEVYRARDTQLKRDVALKVLPEGVTLDADRLARFEREAQALAVLNHPHIAQVYGVVHDGASAAQHEPEPERSGLGGVRAIAMELVEGPTLAERIARGAVPVDEALPLLHQLAGALEYAHERGIVHRDLKPANIKLTPEGAVKVLDFGLAKALNPVTEAPASAGPNAENSPTMTTPAMTRAGIILGTAAYMSPEQARGAAVDKRADIWAFGVVLYEMLTGKACFGGETVTDVLAAVMRGDPDWTELPSATPPRVRELMERCLAKDRRQRLHDMGDARLEIEKSQSPAAGGGTARVTGGWWRLSPMAAIGVTVIAFVAGWLVTKPAAPLAPRPTRVAIDVGASDDNIAVVVAGAPDGSQFVYCGAEGGLWRRRWDRLAPDRIAGFYDGCLGAAFSPDGQQLAVIGYPSSLRIVSATDESTAPRSLPVDELGDIAVWGAMDWASDGNIYVSSPAGLLRVSTTDGRSTLIAKAEPRTRLLTGLDVLPGSQAAVVVVVPPQGALVDGRVGIVSLQSGALAVLDLAGVAARYANPGHLLIAHHDGSLAVVPFDLTSLRPSGPATPLPADRSGVPNQWNQGLIDAGDDGTLLYWASRAGLRCHPVFVDRRGTAAPFSSAPSDRRFQTPRLMTEDALAVEVSDAANSQVHVLDRRSGRTEQLTADGLTNRPVFWNSRDRTLTIVSDRSGSNALYRRRLDGGGLEALPKYDPRPIGDARWSTDGKWLVLRTDDSAPGKGDILAVRPGVDSVARPIAASPEYSEYCPALSPNGRWLAYSTNETGRYEVVVKPFPDARGQWSISSPNGGADPLWSHDGRELFYISDGQLMAVDIAPEPEFRVIAQHRLFSVAPYTRFRWSRNFDISPDDKHFVMLQRNENVPSRIVAVFNWTSELASPAKR